MKLSMALLMAFRSIRSRRGQALILNVRWMAGTCQARGSCKEKVVPSSLFELTAIPPLCASTTSLAI